MAKARHLHTPIYITRAVDTIIDQKINGKEGKVLFVHGDGGFGKSTLLRKYVRYGEEKKIPLIFIDLKEQTNSSMVNILLDEGITFVKNCPKFEEIRTMIIDEPELLSHILNTYTTEASSAVQRLTHGDENYQQIVGTIVDGVKLWNKFSEREREAKKKAILNTPELLLLRALSDDLQGYGVCIIDTFEKIKLSDMVSKINFLNDGTISARSQERHYRFKDYIEGLIYLMVEHTTFIIAGRNRVEDLSMELPLESVESLSMERFSLAQIHEFFTTFAQKHAALGSPTHEQLTKIEILTQGNALLIDLLSQIAQEYPNWEALDYDEMERRVKRVDDKHGLLFYFTDRITSHLRDEESELLWKLVIPRVLTQELEPLLFGTTPLLERLVDTGLARRGLGKEAGKFYLLDNVHSAISNHFEHKYQGNFSSWHDKTEVKALHIQLIDYYHDEKKGYGINSSLEVCYHRMMTRTDFEREFSVRREAFAQSLLGALQFSAEQKKGICHDWEQLGKSAIEDYIQEFSDEKRALQEFFSSALYDELSRALALGKIETVYDSTFLEALSQKEIFSTDWSLFFQMGNAYHLNEKYYRAIASFQKAVEINPKKDEAYYNMGNAYGQKGEHDRAIASYQKAVEINPKKDEAYNNMGIAYHHNEEHDRAIASYQKAVEINPKKDEAYNNMGIAYHHNEEYDSAIASYQKAVEINPKNDTAYNNLFELQLILNRPFDPILEERYVGAFHDHKETFIKYEMLKIIHSIVRGNPVRITAWEEKYQNVRLGGWNFSELEQWNEAMETGTIKVSVTEAIERFKQKR